MTVLNMPGIEMPEPTPEPVQHNMAYALIKAMEWIELVEAAGKERQGKLRHLMIEGYAAGAYARAIQRRLEVIKKLAGHGG